MTFRPNATTFVRALSIAALLAVPGTASAAPKGTMTLPDFTKGDTIPAGAKHDWTLGATGARGWIYSNKLVTSDARQIAITKVDKGSPADGLLATGDVILGVGGKAFSYDPRTEFGKALTAAESDKGGGALVLTRWRAGKIDEVTLKLPMFASGIRLAGLDLLAAHRIREGMDLCIDVMEIDKWGKADRIDRCLKALATYRGAAKPLLPRLRQLEKDLASHGEAKNLKPKIDTLRSLIQDIEKSNESIELRSLK